MYLLLFSLCYYPLCTLPLFLLPCQKSATLYICIYIFLIHMSFCRRRACLCFSSIRSLHINSKKLTCSMSSHAGHVTAETVFEQMLALWFGNGDEHCALESDTTGLNVKGNLYLVSMMGSKRSLRARYMDSRQGSELVAFSEG